MGQQFPLNWRRNELSANCQVLEVQYIEGKPCGTILVDHAGFLNKWPKSWNNAYRIVDCSEDGDELYGQGNGSHPSSEFSRDHFTLTHLSSLASFFRLDVNLAACYHFWGPVPALKMKLSILWWTQDTQKMTVKHHILPLIHPKTKPVVLRASST